METFATTHRLFDRISGDWIGILSQSLVEVCTSGVVETVFLDKVIGVMFTIEIESSSPSDTMSRAERRSGERGKYHLKGISVSVKLWWPGPRLEGRK
jgi:hypothetical protein